ncbi:MAG: polyphosphate kinase [Chloroflexi bacterium]|nr:polyphosphate kinase [Chloroflexota bacterium]
MAMTQANHYTHTSDGILPHTEARRYDVAAFRDVNYAAYRAELRELRLQLLMMQEWVMDTGLRVAVVLEGRDAAGKGSTASGITHYLNPRSAQVIEQRIPTPRQMRNWLGTYYRLMPTAGNITIFDRSWYSRAIIQPAMGFCSMRQYSYFMTHVNDWEQRLVEEGVHLLKVYLSVSKEAQDLRFRIRQDSDLQYWKYSPTDRRVAERWQLLTYFKERMFAVTSTDYAPWMIIDSDNKHQARLNTIHYILSSFEYEGNDLNLKAIEANADKSDRTRNVVVDGVLFRQMTPEQVAVLERIMIHV